MSYRDNKFYSEIVRIDNARIVIKGYRDSFGEGRYTKGEITISPKTINILVDKLNNYGVLEDMTLKEKFKISNDSVSLSISGSDINPTVTISTDHINSDGKLIEGIIDIPFLPLGKELAYYYLGPFLEKLKKYAE